MLNLNNYLNQRFKISQSENIQEKLKIGKNTKINKYNYYPKNKKELVEIVFQKNADNNEYILNLNDIDVSKITDLSYLFENIQPIKVDMNNWDVSNVRDIHGLFWNNNVTKEIHIENWNVINVESAYGAFYFCTNIKELNLDNWNLSSCKEFDLMFKGCENLDTHFTDNWTMPIHPITTDEMFEGCEYKPKWYYKN